MRIGLLFAVIAAAGCTSTGSTGGQVIRGQAPDPSAAAGGAGAGGAAAAGAAAGAKPGLFGKLCNPEKWAKCKKWFCNSPAGQLVNNLLKPVSAMTGGLIPPLCKQDGKDEEKLKKPADSSAGASERLKAEEAGAKAKIADLEYLSTKNCRRFPEAEAALINGLRAEKLECVRLAAARAFLSGCCCTPKVIKALTICVNQSEKDGNLAEESERVRLTAFVALERCLRMCQPAKIEEPPEKPGKGSPEKKEIELTAAGFTADETDRVFTDARNTLARGLQVSDSVMRQMSGPANLRDMITGPRYQPAAPVALTPPSMEQAKPVAEPVRPVPETPKATRGLLGIVRDAVGR